ncbi:MAG: hypothetical protein E7017_07775 [Alphaproteobacteria bacterium]|nr:hypothetical protein [Alphaproteobacteria bacterium]
MKKLIGGKYIEMTKEELSDLAIGLPSISYKDRVINRIRAVYSVDDELAILRQRDTKPEEYREYNAFVERVKAEEKER